MKQKTQSEVTVNERLYNWSKGDGPIVHDGNAVEVCLVYGDSDEERERIAQRIVTAVNSYDDMLEALKSIKEVLEADMSHLCTKNITSMNFQLIELRIKDLINPAIAKATNSK